MIYMAVISLSLYGIQTRKNELENCLSQIVESFLQEHYVPELLRTNETTFFSKEEAAKEIQEEILLRISSDTQTEIDVLACDMEKGLLSVRVTEQFMLPGGNTKTLSFAKTAIIDQQMAEEGFACIRFDVDGSVYKIYYLRPGENYPIPKAPESTMGSFTGWKAADGNSHAIWSSGMTVQGDEIWTATWSGM